MVQHPPDRMWGFRLQHCNFLSSLIPQKQFFYSKSETLIVQFRGIKKKASFYFPVEGVLLKQTSKRRVYFLCDCAFHVAFTKCIWKIIKMKYKWMWGRLWPAASVREGGVFSCWSRPRGSERYCFCFCFLELELNGLGSVDDIPLGETLGRFPAAAPRWLELWQEPSELGFDLWGVLCFCLSVDFQICWNQPLNKR